MEGLALRDCGHSSPQGLEVGLEGGVVIKAKRRDDAAVGLETHLDLLSLADQHELALAGRRIRGTASKQDNACDGKGPQGWSNVHSVDHETPITGFVMVHPNARSIPRNPRTSYATAQRLGPLTDGSRRQPASAAFQAS